MPSKICTIVDKLKTSNYLKQLYNWIQKPWIVFIAISLVFGVFYVFSVPAFGEPDEAAHLNRIYQISEGHLFGQRIPGGKGTYLPKAIVSFENENNDFLFSNVFTARTNPNKVLRPIIVSSGPTINTKSQPVPVHFENTELYSPPVYFPQILGMLFAKAINFTLPQTFYLLRLCGLVSWITICAYGIKKMRKIGWAACVLLLTPLSLLVASSITADSMTTALSVLTVGLVIDAIVYTDKLTNKKLPLIFVTVAFLGLVKPPYLLIATLLLFIPKEKFEEVSFTKIKFFVASFGVMLLLFGGWSTIAEQHYIPARQATGGIIMNQKAHELFIVEHPFSFLHKIYKTYFRNTAYYNYRGFFVGYVSQLGLGDPNYVLPDWGVFIYTILLSGVFIYIRQKNKHEYYLEKYRRYYSLLLVLVLFLAINALIFISWSPISAPLIEGIQARYFIPITMPLLFFLLPIYKKDIKLTRTFYATVPLCLVLIQLAAVLAVHYRFYAPALTPSL